MTALFFCLGPLTAYLAASRISGRKPESFIAALIYSVVAPSAILIHGVGQDMGSAFHLRRLHTLLVYGDGPHIAALALLPLVLLLLHVALQKREARWYVLAGLGMAAVALTNWLGALSLGALAASYLVGVRNWIRAGAVAIFAYALASPWIPPSTVAAVRFNAQTIGGDFRTSTSALFVFLPIALVGLALLRNWPVFAKFGLIMAAFTLGHWWFRFDIVPQPERYHLEMDLGLILAAVPALARLVPQRARTAAFFAVALICGIFALKQILYAGEIIQPTDIRETPEYRSAEFLQKNMPGERVMVPGSIQFWLNAFGETPQIGGGFQQGDINYEDRVATYFIGTWDNVPDVIPWLKAFGIRAIETTGPTSKALYPDFTNARKFDGILEQVWRSGDDTIFRVPGDSLAHVIPRAALVTKPPVNGMDNEELKRYAVALDRPARLTWKGNSRATVEGRIERGQVISVQQNFHQGWHVASGRIFKDGLGFIAIDPACTGDCRIELTFDGGSEMIAAKWASRTALVGGLVWIWISRRRRSSASLATPAKY